MTRLDELRVKLAGRSKGDGTAMPGYKKNVAALQTEIRRLEAQSTAGVDAVATDMVPRTPETLDLEQYLDKLGGYPQPNEAKVG